MSMLVVFKSQATLCDIFFTETESNELNSTTNTEAGLFGKMCSTILL